MTTKFFTARLCSLLMIFLFLTVTQFSLEAQITVKNNTNCTLFVIVSQNDYTTIAPCDQCPVNPPQFVSINPMDSEVTFGQDVCDEQWGWVAWTTNFSSFGITRNPGLGGACGPDALGPGCSSIFTTGAWLLTNANGTGPAAVVIQ